MKKTLEKLNLEKFSPLSIQSQLQVRGGTATGGGKSMIRYESDGNGRIRDYYRSWGSDDIDGGTVCYYKVDYYWTEWY